MFAKPRNVAMISMRQLHKMGKTLIHFFECRQMGFLDNSQILRQKQVVDDSHGTSKDATKHGKP